MISVRPFAQQVRRLLRYPSSDLENYASERWTISAGGQRTIQPAIFLPGQLERIIGTEFATVEQVVRDFQGGHQSLDGETVGFRIKDVDLVDGVLYGPGGIRHLRQRSKKWRPWYRVPGEVVSGSMYESWTGNRWFGSWLMEDCVTHELAQRHGQPITSSPVANGGHASSYEALLSMNPTRVLNAHFNELIVFRDDSNNEGRRQRVDRMRERLVSRASFETHPGVFVLRGQSGDRRVLINEMEIAHQLMSTRGFKILDPLNASVEEIVSSCAGAKVVAGVEGSQLVHGLMCMPRDAALFVIQPPHRVVSVLKLATDRRDQTFAFVVASGSKEEFTVELDDVERTLDLLPGG